MNFPPRFELIAPRIELAAQAPARGKLPLGFSWQSLGRPFRVGYRVRVRDLDDRIVFFALYVAPWTFRVAPVCALDIAPPLVVIIQRNGARGGGENRRASDQILGRRSGKLFFGRRTLGDGDIAGGPHEFLELGVGEPSANNPAPPTRATVKSVDVSSGEPSSSATVVDGKHSSAKPAPSSITAFTVCRVFMNKWTC
jgi:hypothetical protein